MSTPTVPFYPMTHDDAQELISAVRTKDTSNLADVYDPTTTYDVGEFCVHNNMLYKCTTAISSPEAWTAAHWSSEKVCDNLQDTEQTDKIKSDIGIVEDGNAATHAISAGQYVIWKDELYMADDAISIGETLASSGGSKNLTAKPNGLGGEVAALNSKLTNKTGTIAVDNNYIESIHNYLNYARSGNVVVVSGWFLPAQTGIPANTNFITLPYESKNSGGAGIIPTNTNDLRVIKWDVGSKNVFGERAISYDWYYVNFSYITDETA